MDRREDLEARLERSRQALTRRARELEQRADAVKGRVERAVDVKRYAQEQPLATLGAAVGVGALLGILLG